MPSNLNLNSRLLQEAQQISGLKFKKDVINLVLLEYIKRHKQAEIISLFHTIPYYADYDPKHLRKNRGEESV